MLLASPHLDDPAGTYGLEFRGPLRATSTSLCFTGSSWEMHPMLALEVTGFQRGQRTHVE